MAYRVLTEFVILFALRFLPGVVGKVAGGRCRGRGRGCRGGCGGCRRGRGGGGCGSG